MINVLVITDDDVEAQNRVTLCASPVWLTRHGGRSACAPCGGAAPA
jgi:sulfur transfer protein SufE